MVIDMLLNDLMNKPKFSRVGKGSDGEHLFLLEASHKGGFCREGYVKIVHKNVLGKFEEREYAVIDGTVTSICLMGRADPKMQSYYLQNIRYSRRKAA